MVLGEMIEHWHRFMNVETQLEELKKDSRNPEKLRWVAHCLSDEAEYIKTSREE